MKTSRDHHAKLYIHVTFAEVSVFFVFGFFVCLFSFIFSFSLFRCRGIKRKALGKQKE